MNIHGNTMVLRIFIGSTDQYKQQPLYEYLIFEAKRKGLAGATAIKGVMSFGASSIIHSYKFWEVSDKVPLVIELVDEEEKLKQFYEGIEDILLTIKYGCMVTMDKTSVLMYKHGAQRKNIST